MRSFVVALLLVASTAPTALAQSHPSIALPPALDRVLRDYETQWRKGDPTALAALFTADGFALPNGKPPARGAEAIRAAYAKPGGALKLRALSFATADTVGYIIGAYTYDDAKADVGKFVLALRKGPDGRWLIAADMDNAIR
jgi:ketosteroid isomerase-like protein